MNVKKTMLVSALATGLSMPVIGAQAATLQTGDLLTIAAGVPVYDSFGNQVGVSSGSWFGVDNDLNNQISNYEMVPIYPVAGGGVAIGGPAVIQTVTPIDSWTLTGYPGYDYLTAGVTGSTTAGLDFSGWAINYNGSPVVAAVDYGAWTPTNCATLGCSGVSFVADTAAISWNGVYGSNYSLWYSWNFYIEGSWIPTQYILRLEGTVQAVPVPAAVWLFGSGLLGTISVVRRKKRT